MRLRLVLGSVTTGLLACLVACEDEDGTLAPFQLPPGSDGGIPPAAPLDAAAPLDGSPDASVPTKVNVTALARYYEPLASQAPRPGVAVFAVNAAGALVGKATTGADGKASVDLPEGGSVTAVYPKDTERGQISVITYAGVKPGDALTFGDHETNHLATPGGEGQLTVQWAAVASATRYQVFSPCSTSDTTEGLSLSVPLSPNCQTPTAPVAVVAYDGTDRVLASVYLPAATYTPGSTLSITAGQWVSQAAAPNYDVTLTGIIDSVWDIEVRANADFGKSTWQRNRGVASDAHTANASYSVPSTAAKTYVSTTLWASSYAGKQTFLKQGGSPLSIDVGGRPWVTSVVANSTDRFVQWLQSPGPAYDATTLHLHWDMNETDYVWRVLLPPGQSTFDLRTLPAELTALVPEGDFNFDIGLRLIDLSSAKSYDDVRALPEWRLMDPEAAVRDGDEPGVAAADGGEGYSSFYYY